MSCTAEFGPQEATLEHFFHFEHINHLFMISIFIFYEKNCSEWKKEKEEEFITL